MTKRELKLIELLIDMKITVRAEKGNEYSQGVSIGEMLEATRAELTAKVKK
jgi:hypothetical protein